MPLPWLFLCTVPFPNVALFAVWRRGAFPKRARPGGRHFPLRLSLPTLTVQQEDPGSTCRRLGGLLVHMARFRLVT